MTFLHKSYLIITCLVAFFLIPHPEYAVAQSLYLSPDTVKICTGESEVFDIELRADALVEGMSLYSIFISFDKDNLEFNFVADTTYWQCASWDYDSTCVDSPCVAWTYTDSLCNDAICTEWDLDSTAIDSICSEWLLDSIAIDSICTEIILDSNCLLWQCEEWDTLGVCVDSACLIAEVDTTCVGTWEYTDWQVDSTCIGSWEYTAWSVDSICILSECLVWGYLDSVCVAYGECTAWEYDSTCADSIETTSELADFFTIDTVSYAIEEGPLMRDAPGAQSVQFYSRITSDTSELIIESVIFWPKMSVDGPGLLATIHLKNKGSAMVDMVIDSLRVLDLNADPMVVSGEGSTLMFNLPPDPFGLLLPVSGEFIEADLDDSVTLSWGVSGTYCPDDSVLYELVCSDLPNFLGLNTFTIPDLNHTEITLDASSDLWDGRVFWKVRSYNSVGSEIFSNDDYWYFDLDISSDPPGSFNLLIPRDDSLLNTIGQDSEFFQWTEPTTTVPDDTLHYTLYISPSTRGADLDRAVIESLLVPEAVISLDSFALFLQYDWNVKCTNRVGLSTWSSEIFTATFYLRGDANSDEAINVGDPVYLINYIFKGGPPPQYLEQGDANCDGALNIGDPVYLINYVFKGGPPPCQD